MRFHDKTDSAGEDEECTTGCVDDSRPAHSGWYLSPHGDDSPLRVLSGSDGLSWCVLDFSWFGTVGNRSARHAKFRTWSDERAHDGSISRSDDARRNCLGLERRNRWHSAHPLVSCFAFFHNFNCIEPILDND
jgi:hypothetical protein